MVLDPVVVVTTAVTAADASGNAVPTARIQSSSASSMQMAKTAPTLRRNGIHSFFCRSAVRHLELVSLAKRSDAIPPTIHAPAPTNPIQSHQALSMTVYGITVG